MKLFLQTNAKFSSARGLRPQTPQTAPPLRISGYAMLYTWPAKLPNFTFAKSSKYSCQINF